MVSAECLFCMGRRSFYSMLTVPYFKRRTGYIEKYFIVFGVLIALAADCF